MNSKITSFVIPEKARMPERDRSRKPVKETKKRERSPSPSAEHDDKEMEKELKRDLRDRIYKRCLQYVESKNIEADIEERSKKMVSKILDEVFE